MRLGAAVALLTFVTLIGYLGRDGYRDAAGGTISLLDALYYATVSITTTGYGDICGFGTKGRAAVETLIADGAEREIGELRESEPIIAYVRRGELMSFDDDERAARWRSGDLPALYARVSFL